jgi:hypothetical protein
MITDMFDGHTLFGSLEDEFNNGLSGIWRSVTPLLGNLSFE